MSINRPIGPFGRVFVNFNWLFVFVNFFPYIVLGFADVILVAIFVWDEVYVCVKSGFVFEVCEVFDGLWCGLYDLDITSLYTNIPIKNASTFLLLT